MASHCIIFILGFLLKKKEKRTDWNGNFYQTKIPCPLEDFSIDKDSIPAGKCLVSVTDALVTASQHILPEGRRQRGPCRPKMSKRNLSLADEKKQSGGLEHVVSTGLSTDIPCRLSGFEAVPMAPLPPAPRAVCTSVGTPSLWGGKEGLLKARASQRDSRMPLMPLLWGSQQLCASAKPLQHPKIC